MRNTIIPFSGFYDSIHDAELDSALDQEFSEETAMLSGREIMDIMPDDIDPAAEHAAWTLQFDIERENRASVAQLLESIEDIAKGDRPVTMGYFAHYCAMQSMGHGVGLHDAFGREVYEKKKSGFRIANLGPILCSATISTGSEPCTL